MMVDLRLSLVLVLCMAFSAGACGGGNSTAGGTVARGDGAIDLAIVTQQTNSTLFVFLNHCRR